MKNKKSQTTIVFLFLISSVFIIFITAVIAPMGADFSTHMYQAGETILIDGNRTAAKIQDTAVRNELTDTFSSATLSSTDNIQISTGLYQYSWIILLVVVFLIMFLYSRMLVESQRGSGGFI